LFEGGHSADFSVDLKTGTADVDSVGNPSYIVYSTDKQFRLNGYFPGQECSVYFIQQKSGQGYTYYTEVPIHLTDNWGLTMQQLHIKFGERIKAFGGSI